MREPQIAFRRESVMSESFQYESDFLQARKLMPERQYLAENLFNVGSLRDEIGMKVMDNLCDCSSAKSRRRIAEI